MKYLLIFALCACLNVFSVSGMQKPKTLLCMQPCDKKIVADNNESTNACCLVASQIGLGTRIIVDTAQYIAYQTALVPLSLVASLSDAQKKQKTL